MILGIRSKITWKMKWKLGVYIEGKHVGPTCSITIIIGQTCCCRNAGSRAASSRQSLVQLFCFYSCFLSGIPHAELMVSMWPPHHSRHSQNLIALQVFCFQPRMCLAGKAYQSNCLTASTSSALVECKALLRHAPEPHTTIRKCALD